MLRICEVELKMGDFILYYFFLAFENYLRAVDLF